MAGQYVRLLDTRSLAANLFAPPQSVLDLGAYRVIVVDCRFAVLGSAGNLIIETASVNEEGAWRTALTIPVNAAPALLEITLFGRYIRWRTDQNVAGGPVATVDLVAKE